MQVNEVNNLHDLSSLVISELKMFGVKYKKRKIKVLRSTSCSQRLFRCPLNCLQLTDAFLANGKVVQIPKFIVEACSFILNHVEIEGLFRKAGSAAKQKDIRKSLEAGFSLGKSYRVIDVTNILSYFFRELPDPLIPSHIHDTLLESVELKENSVNALLLTCLLLPPLTVNTIAYFMQFLFTVTLYSETNKMNADNLAIVLAPGIMPYLDINSPRFKKHIAIVKILIENANDIGIIPTHISIRLQEFGVSTHDGRSDGIPQTTCNYDQAEKKKKRRSEMFGGLKKIVGSAIGSSEILNKESEVLYSRNKESSESQVRQPQGQSTKPFITMSSKKNKFDNRTNQLITKKRESKSRISLGGNQNTKNSGVNSLVTTVERRWSLVSSGWSKHKNRETMCAKTNSRKPNELSNPVSGTIKENVEQSTLQKSELSIVEDTHDPPMYKSICNSKNEYPAIDTLISADKFKEPKEFRTVCSTLDVNVWSPKKLPSIETELAENVQCKFQKFIMDSEASSTPVINELDKRLNRDLNICRSTDRRIIRSPSARRIGRIRRKSREKNVRLSRNPSWHVSSKLKSSATVGQAETNLNTIYLKSNVNSAQTRTTQSKMTTPDIKKRPHKQDDCNSGEQWLPAENFFPNRNFQHLDMEEKSVNLFATPYFCEYNSTPFTPFRTTHNFENTLFFTPKSSVKTNEHKLSTIKARIALDRRLLSSTPNGEDTNGRDSIARLLTQNAGMVLAKTKLFDGLNGTSVHCVKPKIAVAQQHNTNRRSVGPSKK